MSLNRLRTAISPFRWLSSRTLNSSFSCNFCADRTKGTTLKWSLTASSARLATDIVRRRAGIEIRAHRRQQSEAPALGDRRVLADADQPRAFARAQARPVVFDQEPDSRLGPDRRQSRLWRGVRHGGAHERPPRPPAARNAAVWKGRGCLQARAPSAVAKPTGGDGGLAFAPSWQA